MCTVVRNRDKISITLKTKRSSIEIKSHFVVSYIRVFHVTTVAVKMFQSDVLM